MTGRHSPEAGVAPCLLAFVLLASAPALAAVKTDVVVLRNGDRVTCEVQSLDRGRLLVKTDDMGTLAIEWDNVRSVAAAARFDVDDLEGNRYEGALSPASDTELRITSSSGASVVPLADVAGLQRIGATFWHRLDGSLDVGTSYASATGLFTFDAAGTIRTVRPGHEVSLTGSSNVTEQEGTEDTRRSVGALTYGRRFEGRWLALFKGQLEQNPQLGFDLRSSITAGGGRYLVQGRGIRLLAASGLSVNREKPVEGESATNMELTALVGFDRYAYDFPNVDVSVSVSGFLSLTESGRERLEVQGRLKRELVRDFYATLRGYESYDDKPATEDASRNDWGVTFALGWTF